MLELALHILDIAENSVRAQATLVTIDVNEDWHNDWLTVEIADDGAGMSERVIEKALDPFYTSKKVRRVGLGLPMLKEAAERTGGRFSIGSREGSGTRVTVAFRLSHLDRQPLGDVAGAIVTLIAGNAGVNFLYRHRCGERLFELDTRAIRQEIGDIPLQHAEILTWIRQYLQEGLTEAGSSA
jgi:anti-sigma regulatory factor (Ser/Thr protein kinase)